MPLVVSPRRRRGRAGSPPRPVGVSPAVARASCPRPPAPGPTPLSTTRVRLLGSSSGRSRRLTGETPTRRGRLPALQTSRWLRVAAATPVPQPQLARIANGSCPLPPCLVPTPSPLGWTCPRSFAGQRGRIGKLALSQEERVARCRRFSAGAGRVRGCLPDNHGYWVRG
jgi:hypothetical protein